MKFIPVSKNYTLNDLKIASESVIDTFKLYYSKSPSVKEFIQECKILALLSKKLSFPGPEDHKVLLELSQIAEQTNEIPFLKK